MVRHNLILNPSGRDGTENWVPVNGALLQVSNEAAFYGDNTFKVFKSNQSGSGVSTNAPIQVTGSLPYAVSAYVNVPITFPAVEAASISIRISWMNASLVSVGESTTDVLRVNPSTAWSRVTGVFTAPATAVWARIYIVQLIAGTADAFFLFDAALFEQSTYVGGYVDNIDDPVEAALTSTALTSPPSRTIGGLELNADIIFNDLVLNTIDENNVIWVCTDIDGWWFPAEPQIPSIARGVEDGDYEVSGRVGARQLNLSGSFFPPNRDALPAARDRLIRAVSLVRNGGWLRTNEEPTKAAYVRLSGRPKIQTTNSRGRTDFSIGLRAADPIKYGWNDANNEGITIVEIGRGTNTGVVVNEGTAEVTAVFELTGPIGAGSTIHNSATDETITINQPLRSNTDAGIIVTRELYNNVVFMTTSAPHRLVEGDEIVVSGVGTPFDAVNETFIVLSASDIYPYSFSYGREWTSNIPSAGASGVVTLANRDVLEIDTYERSVTFNGNGVGQRSRISTMTDWIKLTPGNNPITLVDDADNLNIVSKRSSGGTNTLVSGAAHNVSPGQTIDIDFTETANLVRKSLTNNVATLTTQTEHGFSVGDNIDVASTVESPITNKALTSNVATLTTGPTGAFSPNDVITVSLPTSNTVTNKSRTANTATLTTNSPHGFSAGDSVTVALPSSAVITGRELAENHVTLTTSAPHNFSVGDAITVTLPTSATITNKAKIGSSVVITTSAAHNYAVGDKVVMSLPTAATPASLSYDTATYTVTLTTTAAHNYSVGDRITVNLNQATSTTVTNKARTTTACTLTLSATATNLFIVGEKIRVSIADSAYDGDYYVTAVSGTTVTYAKSNAATQATTAASGTAVNVTLNEGYNGTKVVEAVTSTTLTYMYYDYDNSSVSTIARAGTTFGATPTTTNLTNQGMNGTQTLTSTSTTQFTYKV